MTSFVYSHTDSDDFDCGPPTRFTFTATNTQFSVLCAIRNDLVSENVEVFTASITSSEDRSDVVLNPDTTRVEIIDDDGQLMRVCLCLCVCLCVNVIVCVLYTLYNL